MSKYFPICLNVTRRKCVVVGGGRIALRKVLALRDAGAEVLVVSVEFCTELIELGQVRLVRKHYEPDDLDGAFIVIGATDDVTVNRRIANDAEQKGLPVNIVDTPDQCSFTLPASVKRGDFTISISTGGASPALSKHVRRKLENDFGPEYAEFCELLRSVRQHVMNTVSDQAVRKIIFEELATGDLLDILGEHGLDTAAKRAEEVINKTIGNDDNGSS